MVHIVCNRDSWTWKYNSSIYTICSVAYSQDTCNSLLAPTCLCILILLWSIITWLHTCRGAMHVACLSKTLVAISLYIYLKLWCMLSSITKKGEIEITSSPWVILVIHDNISLVGLILLPSAFQISSILEWLGHGQEDVEPLQNSKDKYWQKLKTLHFLF